MQKTILEFGAVADGVTKSTDAFNQAIAFVSENGGGYVTVPAGEYVSGTIILKSNVYLILEPGSIIYGSMEADDFKDVSPSCFVYAKDEHNCGIKGEGVMDLRRQGLGYTPEHGRPHFVVPIGCDRFELRGISLINTGCFTVYCHHCTNVVLDRLYVHSENCENGDGLDFSGSRNVTISNCIIRTGDDAIGLKTHNPEYPCVNFTITNCVLSSMWAGIRLGPETCGDMLNISVSNCVFNDCSDGLKLQLCDHFRMEGLTFSNLNMTNVKRPFFITSNSHPMSGRAEAARPRPGTFRRVLIDNVIADIIQVEHDWFENQLVIWGMPDAVIEDIMISNLYVRARGFGKRDDGRSAETPEFIQYDNDYPDVLYDNPAWPSACFNIRNAARIKLNNCVFEATNPDERPAIVAESVDGLTIIQAEQRNCGGLLRHYRVSGLKLCNCEGEVTEPDAAYAERWDAFRAYTLAEEAKLVAMSDAELPIRRNATVLARIPTDPQQKALAVDYTYEDDGPVFIRFRVGYGSCYVKLNGSEILSWPRRFPYANGQRIILDLTGKLVPGANRIDISFDEKGEGCREVSFVRPGAPADA